MDQDANAQKTIDELVRLNIEAADSTPCHAKRGQHPKHHGCVTANFTILDSIPADLRNGIFAKPQSFDALIRFSNSRQVDDRRADAHGMAIKLLNVPGQKLIEGREAETTQDFVLLDSEVFFTGDLAQYAFLTRGLLQKNQSLLTRVSFWLSLVFRRPLLLFRLTRVANSKPSSPLSSSYFSTVPYSLGKLAVKYLARPTSEREQLPLSTQDGLSEALARDLAGDGFAFDFGVDVQTNATLQPIEDPSISWSAVAGSRREWLARIEIPKQVVDRNSRLAENLAFSPWNAVREHRPLGLINQIRLRVYQRMAVHRHELNEVYPTDTSEVPRTEGCAKNSAPP